MKIKAFLIVVAMCFCMMLCGCQDVEKSYNDEKPSMFVVVEQTSSWEIVYHKETKVMYSVGMGSYNRGDFTLLVNPDGTPMIWDGE